LKLRNQICTAQKVESDVFHNTPPSAAHLPSKVCIASSTVCQIIDINATCPTTRWQRAKQAGVKAVSDTAGLLFFELLFLTFLTLFGSLFTFPDERAITIKAGTRIHAHASWS
jgi:hypothetical protein